MATPTAIVAYLALFVTVGILFLLVNLLVGKLVRPHDPHAEKQEIYECGEPTIGSSFVQFDLRFYVVALLFIIFDVEVAFFFPWAVVFGKANHLSDPQMAVQTESGLTPAAEGLYRELGVSDPTLANTLGAADVTVAQSAGQLAWISFGDILVFFAVLMVGFAYVWKRG
ncbi:MAG: NADH-quinone oxidoreductase subunit A, partial [Planctomycetales bacterium]|nr:NADH-quinone oxidoreductase subunit A [Planctomycetales bacterium]